MDNKTLPYNSQRELAEEALKKVECMPREELFESLRKAGLIENLIPLFRASEEAIAASFPEHTLVAIAYYRRSTTALGLSCRERKCAAFLLPRK